MLARMEGFQNHGLRRLDTADDFNDNLNLRVSKDFLPVVRQKGSVYPLPLFLQIVHKDLLNLNLGANGLFHHIFSALYQLVNAATDGPQP